MNRGMDASREAREWSGIPAEGELLDLLARLPGYVPSGCITLRRTGFRSHYGCAAAGEWLQLRAAPLFLASIR